MSSQPDEFLQKAENAGRDFSHISAHAADVAENTAMELERKARIARKAAVIAREYARLSHRAQEDKKDDVAKEHARRAIQEMTAAADAASMIL